MFLKLESTKCSGCPVAFPPGTFQFEFRPSFPPLGPKWSPMGIQVFLSKWALIAPILYQDLTGTTWGVLKGGVAGSSSNRFSFGLASRLLGKIIGFVTRGGAGLIRRYPGSIRSRRCFSRCSLTFTSKFDNRFSKQSTQNIKRLKAQNNFAKHVVY